MALKRNQAETDAKARPVYTPKQKLQLGLYTEGKQWMIAETLEEYIGLYHRYPNGAVFTGADYTSLSKGLLPYAPAIEPTTVLNIETVPASDDGQSFETRLVETSNSGSFNNSVYHRITGARFHRHTVPTYYYPIVTEKDYKRGSITRYFAEHVSDPTSTIEISPSEFRSQNRDNEKGIDEIIYRLVAMPWNISGPLRECRDRNLETVQFKSFKYKMEGLVRYLSDLDEFHKDRHGISEADITENLYTRGNEYMYADGTVYEGDYHVHPEKGAMEGGKHTNEEHEQLYPIPGAKGLKVQNDLFSPGGEYLLPNGREFRGRYHIHPDTGAMVGREHVSDSHQKLTPISQRESLGIIGGFGGGAY